MKGLDGGTAHHPEFSADSQEVVHARLLASASGSEPSDLQSVKVSVGLLKASTKDDSSSQIQVFHGKQHLLGAISLPRPGVPKDVPLQQFRVVADAGSTAIVLDEYSSNPSGGNLNYCGAGTEAFLRVIRLTPKPALLFSDKVDSCLDNIMNVQGRISAATIHFDRVHSTFVTSMFESDSSQPKYRKYKISPTGVAKIYESNQPPPGYK